MYLNISGADSARRWWTALGSHQKAKMRIMKESDLFKFSLEAKNR